MMSTNVRQKPAKGRNTQEDKLLNTDIYITRHFSQRWLQQLVFRRRWERGR